MTDSDWWSERGRRWRGRITDEGLGEDTELWATLPSNDPVLLSHPSDDEMSVRIDLARTALTEIVSAAEAIDYAYRRMTSALHNAQTSFDAWPDHRLRNEPAASSWFSGHPGTWHACVEFANLVNWARTLGERVSHDWRRIPCGVVSRLAVNDVRRRVKEAFERLQAESLDDARVLANFNLHVGVLPRAGSSAARVIEGRLMLPIPDRITGPTGAGRRLGSWCELSFSGGRDAVTFGADLLSAVDVFMESVLDAFADHATTHRSV